MRKKKKTQQKWGPIQADKGFDVKGALAQIDARRAAKKPEPKVGRLREDIAIRMAAKRTRADILARERIKVPLNKEALKNIREYEKATGIPYVTMEEEKAWRIKGSEKDVINSAKDYLKKPEWLDYRDKAVPLCGIIQRETRDKQGKIQYSRYIIDPRKRILYKVVGNTVEKVKTF